MTNLSILKNDANASLKAFKDLACLLENIRVIQGRYTLGPKWVWKYKLIFNEGRYKKYYIADSIVFSENGVFSDWVDEEDSNGIVFKYTYMDTNSYTYDLYPSTVEVIFPKEWLDEDPNSIIKNYEKEIKESWEACKKEEKELIAKKKDEKKARDEAKEKAQLAKLIKKYGLPNANR